MKGYIPEGSYFIFRELFENETIGSSGNEIKNYTVSSTDLKIIDHQHSTKNKQKMLIFEGGHDILDEWAEHNAVMEPNSFVTDVSFLINAFDPNNADVLTINLMNNLGNHIVRIRLTQGQVWVYVVQETAWRQVEGVPVYLDDEWHEFRFLIHQVNSYMSGGYFEFFMDGYKLWYNPIGLILENVPGDELETIVAPILPDTTKPTTHRFEMEKDGNGGTWYIGGIVGKDWADMIEQPDGCPFYEVVIEGNDKAKYHKLKSNISQLNVGKLTGEVSECKLDLIYPMIADWWDDIYTSNNDDEPEHISCDNKALVFIQQSQLIYHDYKAGVVAPDFDILVCPNAIAGFNSAQVGDYVWIFCQGISENNWFEITNISGDELTLDHNMTANPTTDISYMIVRGMPRINSPSLGDYILIGQFKRINYKWSARPTIEITLLSDLYIAVQKLIYSDSSRFYKKLLTDVLWGHFADPPNEIVDGAEYRGNYHGLLHLLDLTGLGYRYYHDQVFNANIYNVTEDTQDSVVTKVYDIKTSLYNAIKSVAETLLLEFQEYADFEFRNEHIIFFRDRRDEEGTPILDLWSGQSTYVMDRINRSILGCQLEQGTENYVDYVACQGAHDDKGYPLIGDYPHNYNIEGNTRDKKESNQSIRGQDLCNENAQYMHEDLARKPIEGHIQVENTNRIETWFDDTDYDDSIADDCYDRITADKWWNGQSNWFLGNCNGVYALDEKDRTNQAHLYRKPLTLLGEVAESHFSDASSFKFIIKGVRWEFSRQGAVMKIQPNVRPWEIAKHFADTRRQIDWVEKNFIDPDIQECNLLPVPTEHYDIFEDVGITIYPEHNHASWFLVMVGADLQVELNPFNHTFPGQPLGYGFMVRDSVGPGAWQPCNVKLQGTNFIIDIVEVGTEIRFGVGSPANYSWTGVKNRALLDVVALGFGSGDDIDIMWFLTNEYLAEDQPCPRGTTAPQVSVPNIDGYTEWWEQYMVTIYSEGQIPVTTYMTFHIP